MHCIRRHWMTMAVLERALRHVILCVCPRELCINDTNACFSANRLWQDFILIQWCIGWLDIGHLWGWRPQIVATLWLIMELKIWLIDCSFVLSLFFWNGCFIIFMCSKPNTFGTSSVLRFMVFSNHTLCFTLLRIFMTSEASHINKSDKHAFIHYRKLTRSMFLSETLPAPV